MTTPAATSEADDATTGPTLADPDGHRRSEAVYALAARNAPIDQLAPAADDNNPHVRSALAAALVNYPPEDAAPLLGQLLVDTSNARGPVVHVQAAALRAIGELGLTDFADRAEAATCHTDKRLRAAAVRATANLRVERSADIVRLALEDKWYGVRCRAAEAARDLGDDTLLLPLSNALTEQLRSDLPHEPLIGAIVQALGALDKAGTTVQQLISVARRFPRARWEITRAIARIGAPHATWHYRALLDDPDPGLRRFALHGLLSIDVPFTESTVAAVRGLVTDDDHAIRGLAWRVVRRAGGRIEPHELAVARSTIRDCLTVIADLASDGNPDAASLLVDLASLTRTAADTHSCGEPQPTGRPTTPQHDGPAPANPAAS